MVFKSFTKMMIDFDTSNGNLRMVEISPDDTGCKLNLFENIDVTFYDNKIILEGDKVICRYLSCTPDNPEDYDIRESEYYMKEHFTHYKTVKSGLFTTTREPHTELRRELERGYYTLKKRDAVKKTIAYKTLELEELL